jgi:hypothetical protein
VHVLAAVRHHRAFVAARETRERRANARLSTRTRARDAGRARRRVETGLDWLASPRLDR